MKGRECLQVGGRHVQSRAHVSNAQPPQCRGRVQLARKAGQAAVLWQQGVAHEDVCLLCLYDLLMGCSLAAPQQLTSLTHVYKPDCTVFANWCTTAEVTHHFASCASKQQFSA